MRAVFGQRIFDGLRMADEYATEQSMTFPGNLGAPAVASDQDEVLMAR
jgi:hypothetical protein